MDRRSIIFILGMTFIFFMMNQFFFKGEDSSGSPIPEPKTKIEFIRKDAPKALSASQIDQLNLVKLFADAELKNFVSYAIEKDSNYIALDSSIPTLPKEVYIINKQSEVPSPTRAQIRVQQSDSQPGLYSIYPLSKLVTPWIPDEGEFDIKLVYAEGTNVYEIDGTSTGIAQAKFIDTPRRNGVVLLDYERQLNPYGFYDVKNNHIHYLNQIDAFQDFAIQTYPTNKQLQEVQSDERYYIIENDYMQLVFSNFNGALAEINLPFSSKSNPHSVVREIEFDKILQTNYPNNDRFPQHRAFRPSEDGGKKTINPQVGGYYPLLRRDIIGSAGDTSINLNPHYYATAIFERDDFPSLQKYTLTRFENDLIEFQLSDGKRRITKTYSFPKNEKDAPYCVNLSVNIEGDARRLYVGMGIPEVELISGSFTPTLKYRVRNSPKPKIEKIKTPKQLVNYAYVDADWYCNGNGFFGVILDPLNNEVPGLGVHPIPGELVPSRISVIDASFQRYPASKFPGYGMHTPIMAKPGKTDYRIFAGPFDKSILKRIDQTFTDPITGYNPDYRGAQSFHGWFAFISQPFAKFLFIILDFFHSITRSWGISIILLTVVLRLMLYPLNNYSMKSTARMQKISPKVKAIQDKYKSDPKRAQMETMNLYRKEKANPFGGCLPILIQLPFLFGMFDLLKSSFELRGAPFIPGWIDNLTAPDVLFQWSYPLPFVGTAFHLLPVLLGVIMFFQQKIMSTASTAKAVTDQQKQQRSMGNIMTIVFTVLFYHFPSGLNLYWISSMLLGILQQWYVNKQIKAKG